MRLIPGKTKVQIELFKGVSLSDIFIVLIAVMLTVFVLASTLTGKLYIILGIFVVTAGLIFRMDSEPNYIYLMNMLRHFGLKRHFRRRRSDRKIAAASEQAEVKPCENAEAEAETEENAEAEAAEEPAQAEAAEEPAQAEAVEEPAQAEAAEEESAQAEAAEESAQAEAAEESAQAEDEEDDLPPAETPAERAARRKAEREERRADDKILKDKNTTKEQADAIWLKRAAQSAEKKQKKKAGQAAKSADMTEIIGFTGIKDDFIEYGGEYYGAAIEIPPVEFRFFSTYRRDNAIENCFGRILRSLPGEYAMNIVKLERPVIYDQYLDREYQKIEVLRKSYEQGFISEDEFRARVEILCDRIEDLRDICFKNKIIEPFYYIVLYDSDKTQLNLAVGNALELLSNGEMLPHRLNSKELAVFLKYSNSLDFDERAADSIAPEHYAEWAMPQSVSMQGRTVTVNRIVTHNFRVTAYPSLVGDAWLAGVMSVPGTKVVVKCKPMDKEKSVRRIDHSLQELRLQFTSTGVDSKKIELQEHIDTLNSLLSMLQGNNETLLEVNIYVTAYDIAGTRVSLGAKGGDLDSNLPTVNNMKRVVRRAYQEESLKLSGMDFDQENAFVGGQINAYDPLAKMGRGIPSNSVAACFPWIYSHISDANGIKLGSSDGVPVFIDFFRRDSERVNSNMVIVGKSGSGKSYATKSLLANLAADDSKIFIIDPENEYTELAQNLHGKFINVGNAQFGRLNPFHIITSLEDDEADHSGVSGSYATHLQFLEEFFRQILPDCEKDAMEYLNSIIDRMYTNMGITAETDLGSLSPGDYPTFDDLYDAILAEFQSTDNEYIRTMLRTLMNYVSKFASGGRNANIWNGPSTVTTEENFTVFNFQSLLANRNGSIANAQMLLVLKYIDNEIIKNREYNLRHKLNRKVIVVIDEAHVFIDTKFPIALDFMFQLAKRIRKYNGMQIVITQNIKDFVGSEEIARKSTAIINACQYSFIFALAPNDMDDLCRLYEKAGGINESEQEQIVSAPRGQAFTILSPSSRSSFKVSVPKDVVAMFNDEHFTTRYFAGEEGAAAWESIIGDSRTIRAENAAQRPERTAQEPAAVRETSGSVRFVEISAEEFESTRPAAEEAVTAEIPEIPEKEENPVRTEEPKEEKRETEQVIRTVTVNTAGGETERMLGELLNKFSYDSMVSEIRRTVREELENELKLTRRDEAEQAELPEAEPAGTEEEQLPAEAEEVAADEEEYAAEAEEYAAEEEEYADEDEEFLPTEMADEEDEAETMSQPEEETEDYSSFNIMQMLMAEAEKMSSVSPIDMMVEYGEEILEVTLDELVQYNRTHS